MIKVWIKGKFCRETKNKIKITGPDTADIITTNILEWQLKITHEIHLRFLACYS